jgi:hypothetical protein
MTQNPLKKVLRRILRKILASLSKWALKKHKPEIVAIAGEGKTAIAREAIHKVIKSKYPVRRNIEAPDAELVLPLIILGAKEYPGSYLGWLKILARSVGLLLFRPAHKHYLVLEIAYSHKEIFNYFWDLTNPNILVICGNAPYSEAKLRKKVPAAGKGSYSEAKLRKKVPAAGKGSYSEAKLRKKVLAKRGSYLSESQKPRYVINVQETDGLEPYLRAAIRVGKLLEIREEKAKEALANFSLPEARIKILPSKRGGVVVDATHQYYPVSEDSLEEILEAFPGKKIFFTPDTAATPEEAEVKQGEVGIVLGTKKMMWPILLQLTKTPWVD